MPFVFGVLVALAVVFAVQRTKRKYREAGGAAAEPSRIRRSLWLARRWVLEFLGVLLVLLAAWLVVMLMRIWLAN